MDTAHADDSDEHLPTKHGALVESGEAEQIPVVPNASPRKRWLVTIGVAVILVLLGAGDYVGLQQTTKPVARTYHVGILAGLGFFAPSIDGFKQKMSDLGYVEGKNITYDIRVAPAPVGNQNLVKKLVAEKVDLILSYPTEATQEAEAGTAGTSIPVVGTAGIEGVKLLRGTAQHPGGNLTAVRIPSPELALQRFELLHQLAPLAKRIWVPYLKDYPTVEPSLAVVRPAARAAGITLVEAPFVNTQELASYLASRPISGDEGMDAILELAEPLTVTPANNDLIFAFGDKHALPIAGEAIVHSDNGPIVGLFPNIDMLGQLAATSAAKVLSGSPAGSLPILTPDIELHINYRAIQKLGLRIDDGTLSTATEIFR